MLRVNSTRQKLTPAQPKSQQRRRRKRASPMTPTMIIPAGVQENVFCDPVWGFGLAFW
jgi:hypothetical protein